jgi:hypothetical protein
VPQGYWRIGLAGVLASSVFFLLSALTFYVLGVLPGILFNPAIQSPKVIAVVQTLEPLPVMQTAPYIVLAGWSVIFIGYAFLFNHISVLWPHNQWARIWRLTLLMWFFSLLFFEFQGPYNLLGEPLPLLALELVFWAICALGAAAVIVGMTGRQRTA